MQAGSLSYPGGGDPGDLLDPFGRVIRDVVEELVEADGPGGHKLLVIKPLPRDDLEHRKG